MLCSQLCRHTDLPETPAESGRAQVPSLNQASTWGTYLWVIGAQLINRTELDQLLIDAEREIPEGPEQALVP